HPGTSGPSGWPRSAPRSTCRSRGSRSAPVPAPEAMAASGLVSFVAEGPELAVKDLAHDVDRRVTPGVQLELEGGLAEEHVHPGDHLGAALPRQLEHH